MFSSNFLLVADVTFKSLIHFEFIAVTEKKYSVCFHSSPQKHSSIEDCLCYVILALPLAVDMCAAVSWHRFCSTGLSVSMMKP